MKLFIRLFARYVAHVGYLDGKRNFPSENDFVEIPIYSSSAETMSSDLQLADALKTQAASELKDWRQ